MNFGHSVNEKLKADSSREEVLGRGALLELMGIKYVDERRFYREITRLRDMVRD